MTQNKFKIRRTFNLNRRGLILCGEITEGHVMNGDMIIINGLNDKIKIQSIEYVDFHGGYSEVGLVITKPEVDLLYGISLEDLEITIEHEKTK